MPRKTGDIEADIAEILNDCQKTFAAHRRGLAILKQLHADQPDRFLAIYIGFLNRILIVWKREPNVERLVQLTVTFAKEHLSFAIGIMKHLLEHTDAKDRAVRFRTSQLIASIIAALPDDAELEDELWETVSKRMLVRLKDKFPLVRIQAVYALRRLQDPSNNDDPVITELLYLLNQDSNKDVRRAVLSCIGVFKSTLPSILKRTRDVKEDVRKLAYTIVAEKLSVRQLAINQRVAILQDGLDDRGDGARAACLQLLGTVWYNALGADPLKVLAALDVELAESVCEKVAKALLRLHPELVIKSPFYSALTKESAFLFRVACDWYSEEKQVDKLDALLPSTAEWCTQVRNYIVSEDQETDDFTSRQLMLVLPHLDVVEEVGRQTMLALLHDLLPSPVVSSDAVPVLCKTLARVFRSDDEVLHFAIELLAEMRLPLDVLESAEGKANHDARKNEIAAGLERIKLLETTKRQWLRREEKAAKLPVLNQELEELKAKIEKLQTDDKFHETVADACRVRCLLMSEHLLSTTTKGVTHGIIAGLRESTVIPGIRHPSPEVRLRAVTCIGLFALLDTNAARTDGPLLIQIARNDQENVREVALKALLDITLLYGTKVWAGQEGKPSELGIKVMDVIMDSLEEDSAAIKTVAAEGVAKMLLADGVKDVEVFAKLVALFFSPDSADMLLLRQCLSVFFPTYVVNPAHKVTVQQCFLPLVKAVLSSSRQSPLRKVPLANVFPFLLSLVPPPEKPTEEDRAANYNLAVDLARVVLANPQSAEVKSVLKCLRQVGVHKEDQTTVKKLRCLVGEAERYVKDKLTMRALNQYAAELKAMDATPDVELDGDEALELVSKAKQLAAVPPEPAPRGTVSKPPAKRVKKAAAKSNEMKKIAESEDESEGSPSEVESESDSESEKTASKKYIQSSEEDNAGEDSEEEKEVIRVKKTTARSKAAAQPKRRAAKDSEEEPQPKKVASQESDDEPVAPVRQRIAKSGAVPKKEPVQEARPEKRSVRAESASEDEDDKPAAKQQIKKAAAAPARPAATSAAPVATAHKAALPQAAVQRKEVASKPASAPIRPPSLDNKPITSRPVDQKASVAARPAPAAPAQVPRQAIPKSGVPQAQPTQRIHTTVKPPVPRLALEKKAPGAASATAPLRPLQKPNQPGAKGATAAVNKSAVVKAMQGQIQDMLSSDDENSPKSKQTAVRAVLQQIDGMLSD